MRKDTNRARELPDSQVFSGRGKAGYISLCFGIPVCQLESKGDGLSVNAMRTSHHGRIFEFPRAPFEHLSQPFKILRNESRGLLDQQSLRSAARRVGTR